jgi:hypothetical protein
LNSHKKDKRTNTKNELKTGELSVFQSSTMEPSTMSQLECELLARWREDDKKYIDTWVEKIYHAVRKEFVQTDNICEDSPPD